ncbi:MAG TPA: quinolinate synthase NadA, partial [Phycisphaerales bacterium]|nr:quinolinate synthase NadA [Phycisphaerales bacterium]
ERLIILGHHYQTDEVIRHADFTGDSLKLSQLAAKQVAGSAAEFVVFCGVHFMAETADMLTPERVAVILPDLSAGCSMADMADYDDAVAAWDALHAGLDGGRKPWNGRIIPITYINSTAAIKAFVGQRGGAVCTSSNAQFVMQWALAGGTQPKKKGEEIKLLFLPDQHLGRNTSAALGIDTDTGTCLFEPRRAAAGDPLGGVSAERLAAATTILWAGHCSVHKLFRPEHVRAIRSAEKHLAPANRTKVLVHPECVKEVVDQADFSGSTEFIIKTLSTAAPGSRWAVGTEVHLVARVARECARRGVEVRILSDCQCLCTTMYRIDQPHLLWVLDNLAAGKVVNRVSVNPEAKRLALLALDRMLALTGAPSADAAPRAEAPEPAAALTD